MDIDQVIQDSFGKQFKKKGKKTEVRGQRSEDERRKSNKAPFRGGAEKQSEARGQKSESRNQRSANRSQKSNNSPFRAGSGKQSEVRGQKSEVRSQRSEEGRRKSEDGRKRSSRNSSRGARNQNQGGRKRGGRVSQLNDFSLLVKKASNIEETKYVADRSFAQMPLQPQLLQNLQEKGYEMPSQIQNETLEDLLEGNDLIGIASTGTGKTAAFLIPIVERLMIDPLEMAALVIVPTRELAQQVEQEFRSLTKGTRLYSSSFIGGTSVSADFTKARRRNHIIIGTPGRLKDMIDKRALNFNNTPVLVLDEFDRMLDMGFVNDIREIVGGMAQRAQTMLFSATVEKGQEGVINELMEDPITVQVTSGTTSTDRVEQDIIQVPEGEDKFEILQQLIHAEEDKKVLVFTETKRWADKVSTKLNKAGIRADQIHGDKKQNYRLTALRKFKRGDVKVLVATDVAARGIDVQDISLVVNYELPLTYDSYIHRIGRTGRAGKSGKAYTFVN